MGWRWQLRVSVIHSTSLDEASFVLSEEGKRMCWGAGCDVKSFPCQRVRAGRDNATRQRVGWGVVEEEDGSEALEIGRAPSGRSAAPRGEGGVVRVGGQARTRQETRLSDRQAKDLTKTRPSRDSRGARSLWT